MYSDEVSSSYILLVIPSDMLYVIVIMLVYFIYIIQLPECFEGPNPSMHPGSCQLSNLELFRIIVGASHMSGLYCIISYHCHCLSPSILACRPAARFLLFFFSHHHLFNSCYSFHFKSKRTNYFLQKLYPKHFILLLFFFFFLFFLLSSLSSLVSVSSPLHFCFYFNFSFSALFLFSFRNFFSNFHFAFHNSLSS